MKRITFMLILLLSLFPLHCFAEEDVMVVSASSKEASAELVLNIPNRIKAAEELGKRWFCFTTDESGEYCIEIQIKNLRITHAYLEAGRANDNWIQFFLVDSWDEPQANVRINVPKGDVFDYKEKYDEKNYQMKASLKSNETYYILASSYDENDDAYKGNYRIIIKRTK